MDAAALDELNTKENCSANLENSNPIHDIGSELVMDKSGSILESCSTHNELQDSFPISGSIMDAHIEIKNSRVLKNRGNKFLSKVGPRKYELRSSSANEAKIPQSRSNEIHTTTTSDSNSMKVNSSQRRKRKGSNNIRRHLNDEFTKLKQRFRYILSRMNFEQNLIIAYSAEGWKGQSLEKVKLEKEIQRAKSQIIQCKLKIRDLFQQLSSLCSVGKIPDSLFDSEGQICSEDIFCAKCGSKDLSIDNDIILCDGVCDRGFHQKCLDPPLLSEEIPSGDDEWLCPGCNCKTDCVQLLNEHQGTNLSILDIWEKIFPEVANVVEGSTLDNFGLPSDDSGDDDYDPDHSEVDEKAQDNSSESSSSNESDFTSTSEEFEVTTNGNHLDVNGFSSDDPEDDDYDPEKPEPEMDQKEGSTSDESDFTSDSEGSSASNVNHNEIASSSEIYLSSANHFEPRLSLNNMKHASPRIRKSSINSELLSILESDMGHENELHLSGKRNRERLDYKKLNDEAYGTLPSESSDDEDWTSTPKKVKNINETINSVILRETAHDTMNTESTRSRRTRSQKRDQSQSPKLVQPQTDGKEAGHISKQVTQQILHDRLTSEIKKCTQGFNNKDHGAIKLGKSPNRQQSHGSLEEVGCIPRQGSPQKLHYDATNDSANKVNTSDPFTKGCDGPPKVSNRNLGREASQKLRESLKESLYPNRQVKESLAKDLGLTVRQVSKWFENARRSWRLSSTFGVSQKWVSNSNKNNPIKTSTNDLLNTNGIQSNNVTVEGLENKQIPRENNQ